MVLTILNINSGKIARLTYFVYRKKIHRYFEFIGLFKYVRFTLFKVNTIKENTIFYLIKLPINQHQYFDNQLTNN